MTKDGKGDRNRAPIQITKKNICMTSKVIGVLTTVAWTQQQGSRALCRLAIACCF